MGYSSDKPLESLFDQEPMRAATRRTVERVRSRLREEVKKRTPVAQPPPGLTATQFAGSRGRAPGTLRESWVEGDVTPTKTPLGVEGFAADVLTEDPIAPHVEYPTRPHVIRPSPGRAAASVLATGKPRLPGTSPHARLRFVNRFGKVIYAAEVHHPGTQGVHMMRDSLVEIDATWQDREGAEEMDRWARELF